MLELVVVRPERFVLAEPVVDPRALAPLALVDRPLQATHVSNFVVSFRALVGHQPDAALIGVDLATAVRVDTATRAVAQLLGAGHRARVGRHWQRALAAHAAAEQLLLRSSFDRGEDLVDAGRFLQELANCGPDRDVPIQDVVEAVHRLGRGPRAERAGQIGGGGSRHAGSLLVRLPPDEGDLLPVAATKFRTFGLWGSHKP